MDMKATWSSWLDILGHEISWAGGAGYPTTWADWLGTHTPTVRLVWLGQSSHGGQSASPAAGERKRDRSVMLHMHANDTAPLPEDGDTPGEPDVGPEPTILEPGHNVWSVTEAWRATALQDAAAYFGTLRRAMLAARQSIIIVGWDIDSRVALVGEAGRPEDKLPAALGPFLTALARRRPELSIRLLLWDYSVLYTLERELLPALALQWDTPPQVELCLDNTVPLGASHHQKMVIIDDTLAFAGGLDLTIRRWDRPDHLPRNPRRVDPQGRSYPPFHDVQVMVDGPAAAALAELARARWTRAACEALPPVRAAANDPWPRGLRRTFAMCGSASRAPRPRSATTPNCGRWRRCSATWSAPPSATSISNASS